MPKPYVLKGPSEKQHVNWKHVIKQMEFQKTNTHVQHARAGLQKLRLQGINLFFNINLRKPYVLKEHYGKQVVNAQKS